MCSIFVFLIGPVFGSLIPDGTMSYCQFEYETAYAQWESDKTNHNIGIFMLPNDEIVRASLDPSPATFMSIHGPWMDKQDKFRAEVSKRHHCPPVSNLQHFKDEFSKYLHSLDTSAITKRPTGSPEISDFGLQFEKIPLGHPFKNYAKAFQTMDEVVIRNLIERQKKEGGIPTINMKLISVAMTYSWSTVIDTIIPKLLEDEPDLRLHMELLFVDALHLEDAKLSKSSRYPTDWVEKSRETEKNASKLAKFLEESSETRLGITIKSYKNLPHWHGWLVNDTYLFLGRTNWRFDGPKAYLLVGQSKYRYFDNLGEIEGKERVDIFLEWHKYYWDFASTIICSHPQDAE